MVFAVLPRSAVGCIRRTRDVVSLLGAARAVGHALLLHLGLATPFLSSTVQPPSRASVAGATCLHPRWRRYYRHDRHNRSPSRLLRVGRVLPSRCTVDKRRSHPSDACSTRSLQSLVVLPVPPRPVAARLRAAISTRGRVCHACQGAYSPAHASPCSSVHGLLPTG